MNKTLIKGIHKNASFNKRFFDKVYTISGSEHMETLNNYNLPYRVCIEKMPHEGIVSNVKGPNFENVRSLAIVNCHKNFSPTYLLRYKNIYNISQLYLDSDPCEEYVIEDFNTFTRPDFVGFLDFKYKRLFDRIHIDRKNKWKLVYPI